MGSRCCDPDPHVARIAKDIARMSESGLAPRPVADSAIFDHPLPPSYSLVTKEATFRDCEHSLRLRQSAPAVRGGGGSVTSMEVSHIEEPDAAWLGCACSSLLSDLKRCLWPLDASKRSM